MDTDQRPVALLPRRPRRSAGQALPPEAIFAQRLNRLSATVYPPGAAPTPPQNSFAWSTRGAPAYLRHICPSFALGSVSVPPRGQFTRIAMFFGIHPYYFTDDDHEYTRNLEAELDWLTLDRDPTVRCLTTALLQLPANVREGILAAVD